MYIIDYSLEKLSLVCLMVLCHDIKIALLPNSSLWGLSKVHEGI